MGILVAISIVLILLLRIPFPTATFLEYDAGDIPILIGGFIYGPLAGIALTIAASVVQALTVSSASGWIGCVMHIFATSALVGIAAAIYKKNKTLKRAIIGLICGSIATTAIMIVLNLIMDPLFYAMPVDAVIKLILPALLPFNLLKAGINSIITLLVYKSVGKLLRHIAEK
jgi:riboflavin transporter FmnP